MALAWIGRRLLRGGSAEGAAGVAQHAAAPDAPFFGVLGDAAANGAERATLAEDTWRNAQLTARDASQPHFAAVQQAARPRARPATAAASRALLDAIGAGSACQRATPEREAADSTARLIQRESPRLAARANACPAAGLAVAGGIAEPCGSGARRSVQQLRLKHAAPSLPCGFPTGPWQTDKAALDEINTFTTDTRTDSGGFAVGWGSKKAATSAAGWARGTRKKVICHQHKEPHHCKWSMWLEECVEGWVVSDLSGHNDDIGESHSHLLAQTREEANAHAAMRSIPEELLPTAKSMVAAGLRVADVVRWLIRQVKATGDEVAFNYMDVYHATGASTVERALDATNMMEALRQREQQDGLFFRSQTDSEGCLKSVFFAMHGAHEIYAVDAKRQVVEIDTKVCCACQPTPRRLAHAEVLCFAFAASHAVIARSRSMAPTMRG